MSTQQPDLEFDSLVRAAVHLPNWLQLRNEDPLVQLHTKFWGKNLTYEESVLSDNQTHTESGLSDGDQCMDVDDDGDFVPGCAILNIGIDDLPFEKIWIRADYIRIYDFLESLWSAIAWHQQPWSPGNPGSVTPLCRFGILLLTYVSA
jgi:hypothetical protein